MAGETGGHFPADTLPDMCTLSEETIRNVQTVRVSRLPQRRWICRAYGSTGRKSDRTAGHGIL